MRENQNLVLAGISDARDILAPADAALEIITFAGTTLYFLTPVGAAAPLDPFTRAAVPLVPKMALVYPDGARSVDGGCKVSGFAGIKLLAILRFWRRERAAFYLIFWLLFAEMFYSFAAAILPRFPSTHSHTLDSGPVWFLHRPRIECMGMSGWETGYFVIFYAVTAYFSRRDLVWPRALYHATHPSTFLPYLLREGLWIIKCIKDLFRVYNRQK